MSGNLCHPPQFGMRHTTKAFGAVNSHRDLFILWSRIKITFTFATKNGRITLVFMRYYEMINAQL